MRARQAVLWMGLMAVVAGCDEPVVEHPGPAQAWADVANVEAPQGAVVAEVDGVPITAEEVRAEWQAHPQLSSQQVLDRLIERQVLVARATGEDMAPSTVVSFARKQGMVTALIEDEIANVEVDDGQRAALMEDVATRRGVPPGLRASHLVIVVPQEIEDGQGEMQRLSAAQREPYFEEARAYLDVAREELATTADDEALRQVAKTLNEEVLEPPFGAVVNEHLRFPRAGSAYEPTNLPRGWMEVVPEFAEGAETVAEPAMLGQLSAPVRTSFGWHLIRVDESIDARPVDDAQARRYVDAELRRWAQEEYFTQWAGGFMDNATIEFYADRLSAPMAQ